MRRRTVRQKRAVYTVDEVGALLDLSRASIYRAIKAGTLPVLSIGGLKKIPKAVIDRMLGLDAAA